MALHLILLFGFTMFCWRYGLAQNIIWQESFDYPHGTTVGSNLNQTNPASDWISGGCMACADTADWWEVRNGVMEARDVNEVVFLQTEAIDISRLRNAQFSLDIAEIGDHEGLYFGLDACADQDKEDYVNVLYRIDGGSWNLVSNALNWCGLYASCGSHTLYGDDGINSGDCRDHDDDWGSVSIRVTNLSGNLLEIRIEIINSATDEIIRLDNLVVQGEIILPVTLVSFDVSTFQSVVRLSWQTISEINNDHFVIERRSLTSLADWEAIAMVNGAGTSYLSNEYYYEDRQPYLGRSLYRLKQVDFDGNFEYSEIKQVTVQSSMNPFPNPAKNIVYVPLRQETPMPNLISLYTVSGAEICLEYQQNKNYIVLNTNNLTNGYYLINLNNINYRIWILK
jgi:hypothetical protein